MSIHRLDGRKSAARHQVGISGPLAPHDENEWTGRMYAIAFDLDAEQLKEVYEGSSWNNACFELRRVMEARGFRWRQGSVYFGNDDVRSKDCIKVVMDLDKAR